MIDSAVFTELFYTFLSILEPSDQSLVWNYPFYSFFWQFCHFIWSPVCLKAFLHSSSNVNHWIFYYIKIQTTLSQLPAKNISPAYCPIWEAVWWMFGDYFQTEKIFQLTFLEVVQTFSSLRVQGKSDAIQNIQLPYSSKVATVAYAY